MARPRGRPPTGKYIIKDMIEIIDKYTDESDYPILKEACFLNGWDYDTVMRKRNSSEELSRSIKRLMNKREIILEQGVQFGQLDRTFSIFALKQPVHGWTDKPPEEASGADAISKLESIARGLISGIKSETD